MHVQSIVETIVNNEHFSFVVSIEDALDAALADATVTLEVTSPLGNPHRFSALTDANGEVSYSAYGYQNGEYDITVLSLYHATEARNAPGDVETTEAAAVFA